MSMDRADMPALEELREHWWLYMLFGLITVAAGVAAILLPFAAAVVTATMIGILLVVAGFAGAVYAVRRRRSAGQLLLGLLVSVLYVVAGLVLLASPTAGAFTLTLVLGILFVIGGATRIVAALRSMGTSAWGWDLVGGVLSLILGTIIWSRWPLTAFWAIGLIVGVDLIYLGWTMVQFSLMAHSYAIAGGPRLAGQH